MEEVEIRDEKPRMARMVAVRAPEYPVSQRYVTSRVRPALLVGGDTAMRYVGSVGDRVVLDDGVYGRDRRYFDGEINNSFL